MTITLRVDTKEVVIGDRTVQWLHVASKLNAKPWTLNKRCSACGESGLRRGQPTRPVSLTFSATGPGDGEGGGNLSERRRLDMDV